MADEPQAAGEQREVARHLVQHPLVAKEHDPERFRLIRRHEAELDRWFTQRLGYRLHVDGDTARLYKTGYVPERRPLRTSTGRAFHRREYILLALVLASTAAGPDVISLRDLVDQIRSAAAETGIVLTDESVDRRAVVSVLSWMIARGLAVELHSRVDAYAADDQADAVLKLRPDRIVLLALPALAGAPDVETLLAQAERRSGGRQWMRSRLVEDPVLYRADLADAEWAELRRRLGDEASFLDEMFGLRLEARAEGVAAIDPAGTLTEHRFPATGTVAHAALLLIDAVVRNGDPIDPIDPIDPDAPDAPDTPTTNGVVERTMTDIVALVGSLAAEHASHWSNDLVAAPEKLAARVVELLVDLRLAEVDGTRPVERATGDATADDADADDAEGPDDAVDGSDPPLDRPAGETLPPGPAVTVRLLPAAARFAAASPIGPADADAPQESLW